MIKGYIHPGFSSVAHTLAKQLPKNGIGGAAVSVYFKGRQVVDIWGGTQNREGRPWERDTLALSFSTTKGIMSTLIHILVDEGLADYDDPVCKHWPEFGKNGKEKITIRQAMSHEAGIYNFSDAVDDFHDIYDWQKMLDATAAMRPVHEPGKANGYHTINYGFLTGGIIEGITGKSFQEVLEEKLVQPLDLDGLYIGLPEKEHHRAAKLITLDGKFKLPDVSKNMASTIGFNSSALILRLLGVNISEILRTVPKTKNPVDLNSAEAVSAKIPGANGMFTARSLSKMYAAIANGGELDGVRILSRNRTRIMELVQNRRFDRIIPIPVHWRLGYHRIFGVGADVSRAFGHCGFGGSGAWCDPSRNLSMAMTLNSGLGTPIGDSRILFMSRAVMKCVTDIEKSGSFDPGFIPESMSSAETVIS